VKRVGLVLHPTNPTAREAGDRLRRLGAAQGILVEEASAGSGYEVVVALGGDGTILRAAKIAWQLDVPVLGVNLGNLGFLSTVDVDQLDQVVEGLATNRYRLEERMMLEATAISSQVEAAKVVALNEIVVERVTPTRVVDIRLSVGQERVATYTADGFIVSTPTGSTAYSLSAGGPVVEPQVQAMVLTAVSAHAPLWRSIVVSPDRMVTLETPNAVAFSADGQQVETLAPGSKVTVIPHTRPLKLLNLVRPNFYQKLRSRFHVDPGR
jgi:NAD+ kinase